MDGFDIPIVLFTFKREKVVDVLKKIAIIKPKKLYILSDAGRNNIEKEAVNRCRIAVEQQINWPCEVIKNYAIENKGVYENIAGGARWVFERESKAIFLEDDNLPEVSFFWFCKEMLNKYENNESILWVCGTNYLEKYKTKNNESYVFTKHMLPCGWASWSNKFLKYYDGNVEKCEDLDVLKIVKKNYINNKIYRQYKASWQRERNRIKKGEKPVSWDYQMDFSIKSNGLYGICPKYNQIKNIGVDDCSIHGGNSFSKIMTRRFCGMDSLPLEFPLVHPQNIQIDKKFEKKIGKIILYPFAKRLQFNISSAIRKLFSIPMDISIKEYFFRRGKKHDN